MKLLRRKASEALPAYRRSAEVTIRWATPADKPRLEALAALDEARVPAAPILLGLVGDELWVAVSLSTGAAITDPFRQSADVAFLVIERGRQLTVAEPRYVWSSSMRSGRAALRLEQDRS
jgi:hypothetical protein